MKIKLDKTLRAERYVLIDYENRSISDNELNTLLARKYTVIVFDGINKRNIIKDFYRLSMQKQTKFWFEIVNKTGKNKVDGIIASWALDIFRNQDNAHVYIVSMDSDYDDIIRFCQKPKWYIERNCCIKNVLKESCDCKSRRQTP